MKLARTIEHQQNYVQWTHQIKVTVFNYISLIPLRSFFKMPPFLITQELNAVFSWQIGANGVRIKIKLKVLSKCNFVVNNTSSIYSTWQYKSTHLNSSFTATSCLTFYFTITRTVSNTMISFSRRDRAAV